MLLVCTSLVIILVLSIYYWYIKKREECTYIKRFGTPPGLPFIGIAHLFLNPHNMVETALDLFEKYGPNLIVQLGPIRRLIINEPELLEHIMGSTKYIDKGGEYGFTFNWIGEGLLTSKGKKWKSHRKVITPTFHYKILEEFVGIFNKESDVLVKQLRAELSKEEFDVYPYICLCTLDIICETAMGVSLNIQQNPSSNFYTSVKDMCDMMYYRCLNPLMRIDFLYRFTEVYGREKRAIEILKSFSDNIITTRRKQKQQEQQAEKQETDDFNVKKRVFFLDMLLDCEIDGKPLTHEEIQDEVDTFIFEGHDTTAVAISFALYSLSINQEIQEKCYEEITNILGSDKNAHPTHADLLEMKYLEMVIKEALRLYPSVPGYSRQLKEDVIFEDIIIPKGLEIVVTPLSLHRDRKIYPEPNEFIPERFTLEECAKRHPYAYLPFSAGPRNCIGQKFAMLELKSTISKVLRHYKLFPVAGNYKPHVLAKVTLQSANGIKIRIEER